MIRLKDGETNMLAGLIRDEERQVLSGIPGLSDLPVVGRLFAHNQRETQETDIILTLTPRIVRVLDLQRRRSAAVPRRPRQRRAAHRHSAAAAAPDPPPAAGRRSRGCRPTSPLLPIRSRRRVSRCRRMPPPA